MTPTTCPKCKCDLGPADGPSRVIGQSYHDRVVSWRCPDCSHMWRRTEPGNPGGFRTFNVEIIR